MTEEKIEEIMDLVDDLRTASSFSAALDYKREIREKLDAFIDKSALMRLRGYVCKASFSSGADKYSAMCILDELEGKKQ